MLKVLIENTKKDDSLVSSHGLSLILEYKGTKILMDMGPDRSFAANAKKMNVNLKDVYIALVSHCHNDHSGGLADFMKINKQSNVFVGKGFFSDFYSKEEKVLGFLKRSLDNSLYDEGRFVFVNGEYKADNNLTLISKLGYQFDNLLNDKFYVKEDNKLKKDDFSHELAAVIKDKDDTFLISGCFHSGVINTYYSAEKLGFEPNVIIGGFHLENSKEETAGEKQIKDLIKFANDKKLMLYTGHCTGRIYKKLEEELGSFVKPLYSGAEYIL